MKRQSSSERDRDREGEEEPSKLQRRSVQARNSTKESEKTWATWGPAKWGDWTDKKQAEPQPGHAVWGQMKPKHEIQAPHAPVPPPEGLPPRTVLSPNHPLQLVYDVTDYYKANGYSFDFETVAKLGGWLRCVLCVCILYDLFVNVTFIKVSKCYMLNWI